MLVPINNHGLALCLELNTKQINRMIDEINEFGYEARFDKFEQSDYDEDEKCYYWHGEIVYPNFYEIDKEVCVWEGVDCIEDCPEYNRNGKPWEYRTHPESY